MTSPQTLYSLFVQVFEKGFNYGLTNGLLIGFGFGVVLTIIAYAIIKHLSKNKK
jgi:heme/copper-type cytochrome/quinol oxidase subunit 4